MKIIYDVINKQVTDKEELGLTGFMSFNRLAQLFSDTEINDSQEYLSQIEVTERGLNLRYKRK